MPHLATLRVFDNSEEADPKTGQAPKTGLVLHMENGRIVAPRDFSATPAWAKAIVARAIELQRRAR